jgi:hypothetical protein
MDLVSQTICNCTLPLTFQCFVKFKGQVTVCWIVMPCSDVAGYQRFGGPCCLHLQGEVTWNAGILPQQYTTLQPRRPGLDCNISFIFTRRDLYLQQPKFIAKDPKRAVPSLAVHVALLLPVLWNMTSLWRRATHLYMFLRQEISQQSIRSHSRCMRSVKDWTPQTFHTDTRFWHSAGWTGVQWIFAVGFMCNKYYKTLHTSQKIHKTPLVFTDQVT